MAGDDGMDDELVLVDELELLQPGGKRLTAGARGFFFVWTLLAVGASGVFSTVLAATALWRSVRAGVGAPGRVTAS